MIAAMSDALNRYTNLYQQGHYSELIDAFAKLNKTLQQSPAIRNYLAAAFYEQGQIADALTTLQAIVKDHPTYADAYKNLGMIALEEGRLQDALNAYQLAEKYNPEDIESAYDQAEILMRIGDVTKTDAALQRCLTKQPNHTKAQLLKQTLYFNVLPPARWPMIRQLVKKPETLQPSMQVIHAQQDLLISWHLAEDAAILSQKLQYFSNKLDALIAHPTKANHHNQTGAEKSIRSYTAYCHFFKHLLQAQPTPPSRDEALPALYLVGDSHSLCPHQQTVVWQGSPHQVHTQLVMGLKLWHLVSPTPSLQRSAFIARIKSQPMDTPILLSAGEIDTRLNEGILPYSQKKSVPYQGVLQETFDPAILFFKKLTEGRSAGICGIPAPCIETLVKQERPESEWAGYAGFVQEANQRLKALAAAHDLAFVDLHALSAESKRFDSGQWSLEGRHLKPGALAASLNR